eukprot:TRINITY_DN7787_c1_g1_i10.p1 TRINITY_DN7787_c1_g1~~TRINITY_DN7787_c1_g1_i10.p1  ORF type:complete len:140 (+),score=4.10 TRINITY_DN7787_c1_g1_i10:1667-2086(+)
MRICSTGEWLVLHFSSNSSSNDGINLIKLVDTYCSNSNKRNSSSNDGINLIKLVDTYCSNSNKRNSSSNDGINLIKLVDTYCSNSNKRSIFTPAKKYYGRYLSYKKNCIPRLLQVTRLSRVYQTTSMHSSMAPSYHRTL